MSVLTIRIKAGNVICDVYNFYKARKSVHVLTIQLKFVENVYQLIIDRDGNFKQVRQKVECMADDSIDKKLGFIFSNEIFNKFDFNYIVNLIDYGGEAYSDINLFSDKTYKELLKLSTTHQQQDQLSCSRILLNKYIKAKHYFCYDSGFFNSCDIIKQRYLDLPQNKEDGLFYLDICEKLPNYVARKDAKKEWVLVDIEDKFIRFSVIKKLKCLVSFKAALSIISLSSKGEDSIDQHSVIKTAQYIAQIITSMDEIEGIVLSGGLGCTMPRLRKKIFKHLQWADIILSSKKNNANAHIINKKNSKMPVVVIKADESYAMINLLATRLFYLD